MQGGGGIHWSRETMLYTGNLVEIGTGATLSKYPAFPLPPLFKKKEK